MRHFSQRCAVALAVGLLGFGGQAFGAEMEDLTVVERATSDTVIDLGEAGDSAGDLLTFANEIFDATNSTKLGSNNGYCIRTAPGVAWECFWTLFLEGGQITVHGPFLDVGESVLAVTGGTGKYASVSGEMKLRARNAEGSEYDFIYSLQY